MIFKNEYIEISDISFYVKIPFYSVFCKVVKGQVLVPVPSMSSHVGPISNRCMGWAVEKEIHMVWSNFASSLQRPSLVFEVTAHYTYSHSPCLNECLGWINACSACSCALSCNFINMFHCDFPVFRVHAKGSVVQKESKVVWTPEGFSVINNLYNSDRKGLAP